MLKKNFFAHKQTSTERKLSASVAAETNAAKHNKDSSETSAPKAIKWVPSGTKE